MSMQTDAEFQKEQNGTLFVWVGALGGGYWGGGGSRAPKLKKGLTSNTFFLAPPGRSKNFLRNFKYIRGILISLPIDWHPFWANWVKGGVCGHVQKSEAHALGCRPRGESSQWSSNLPQTYRIVPAWDSEIQKKWKQCGTVQATYGCLVGHVHGRPYLIFCPITLQHFSLRS